MRKNVIGKAFINTVPIMAGYVFLGFAFGLLMKTKGYPGWSPLVMSAIIYSGALEYAAVPILAQPFDPAGALFLGLMLSARHLFYGIPMLKKYNTGGLKKVFLIFGLTDETFSLLTSDSGKNDTGYYTAVTFFNYLYWNAGTVLGTLFGGIVLFNADGLDFALTALFIVLFIEQLKNREGIISGLCGLTVSAVVLAVFGADKMVIISMLVIAVMLISFRKVIIHE